MCCCWVLGAGCGLAAPRTSDLVLGQVLEQRVVLCVPRVQLSATGSCDHDRGQLQRRRRRRRRRRAHLKAADDKMQVIDLLRHRHDAGPPAVHLFGRTSPVEQRRPQAREGRRAEAAGGRRRAQVAGRSTPAAAAGRAQQRVRMQGRGRAESIHTPAVQA